MNKPMKLCVVGSALISLGVMTGCSSTEADEALEAVDAGWVDEQVAESGGSLDKLEKKTSDLKAAVKALQDDVAYPFDDVTPENLDYAFREIMTLYQDEVIQGYPDEGKFYPHKGITRYQAGSMMLKALGHNETLPYEPVFTDVDEDFWALDEAMLLYHHGLMRGTDDGRLAPSEPIQRAHMAVVLTRAFDLEDTGEPVEDYVDVDEGFWAYDEIRLVSQHGIAKGSEGRFSPFDTTTRAQFSLFLYRALFEDDE